MPTTTTWRAPARSARAIASGAAAVLLSLAPALLPVRAASVPRPDRLAPGAAFIDLILPIPAEDGLESDCWGGTNVRPRVVRNGIEDPQWSYWCASGLRGPDGKEHLFAVRWPQAKGHKYWVRSEVVHAVADQPTGPFAVVEELGPGHNVDVHRAKDGTRVVSVTGRAYLSKSLRGPWESVKAEFDVKESSMSNKTFAPREDGSVLMVLRAGTLWLSDDGLQPYRRIFPTSVYPFDRARGSTAFEDPCLWRDEVQYHLIVNNWPARTAFYGRSPDGLHWTWDAGTAYDSNVVRHPDGTVERWNKLERPKVRQDALGRATHLYLAAIDCPKEQCDGTTSSSSKSLVLPLVVGRRLAMLDERPIGAETTALRVAIRAEPGFDPLRAVDVASLRFGAPSAVNAGGGCRAVRSDPDGTNLVVTFAAEGHGLTDADFAAKLLGRTSRGELLFGYARLPGQPAHRPMLVARMPVFARGADGALAVAVPVENAGLAASTAPAPVRLALREPRQGRDPGAELHSGAMTISALPPYGSVNVTLQVPAGSAEPGRACDLDVAVGADVFAFKRLVLP